MMALSPDSGWVRDVGHLNVSSDWDKPGPERSQHRTPERSLLYKHAGLKNCPLNDHKEGLTLTARLPDLRLAATLTGRR